VVLTPETVDCRGILLIQGDSGTGKTTICNWIAPALGAEIYDTSNIFRGATAAALRWGVSYEDTEGCARLADGFSYYEVGVRTIVMGYDVTDDLRTAETTAVVSHYAGLKVLRKAYIKFTLDWVNTRPAIVPGRHMQEVFPRSLTIHVMRDLEESKRMREIQVGDTNADLIAPRIAKDRENAAVAGVDLSSVKIIDTTGMSKEAQAMQVLLLASEVGFKVNFDKLGYGQDQSRV
jgi:cytidylate kinase